MVIGLINKWLASRAFPFAKNLHKWLGKWREIEDKKLAEKMTKIGTET